MEAKSFRKKYLIPILASTLFVVLTVITVLILTRYSGSYTDNIISNDISKLTKIFNKIDKDSVIIGFEHQKNYIDFLNVVKFSGSEVGSMNLAHPEKWQGPYLKENLSVQKKLYQIISNKNGYYIVPGDGVKIGNGKIIGKDIIFKFESDLDSMLKDKSMLLSNGKPLASKLNISKANINVNILNPMLKNFID